MENHTARTREALVKDVTHLKRDAVQVAQDVKDHATAHVNKTKKKVTHTFETFRERVTAHPFAVLGVGFALGLLFGRKLRI